MTTINNEAAGTAETPEIIEETETDAQSEPRPIEDLLKLKTYQGMSDEEIELVITYRENVKLYEVENRAKIAAIMEEGTRSAAAYQQIADNAINNLNNILTTQLNLKVVERNEQ